MPPHLRKRRRDSAGTPRMATVPPRFVVKASVVHRRVRDIYISWRREIVQHRVTIASDRYRDAARKLEDWLAIIELMAKPEKSADKHDLPPDLRRRFLSIIEPASPESPVEEAHRHRNYALLRI